MWVVSATGLNEEKPMKDFIVKRFKEKSSHGGAALIAIGVVVLIAGPFAKIAAYAAIAYGIYQIATKG